MKRPRFAKRGGWFLGLNDLSLITSARLTTLIKAVFTLRIPIFSHILSIVFSVAYPPIDRDEVCKEIFEQAKKLKNIVRHKGIELIFGILFR